MTSYVKKAKRVYRKAKKYGSKAMKIANKVNNNKYVRGAATLYSLGQKVAMLSHLVNIEKKRSDITVSTATAVAQTYGAGVSGAYAAVIAPTCIEGIGQGQRIGLSLKLVSGCLDIQFVQQASTLNNLKLKWWIVSRPDNSSGFTAPTSIAQFFEVNPFSGVNDYYSSRDPEYFTAFRVIKCGTIVLHQDSTTGASAAVQKKIPLKFNHHLKYNTDGSTTTTKNQMYLFVTCSGGDLGLATGATIQYNMRWYYTDN